jgi:outer membrane protein assembly factor BamA
VALARPWTWLGARLALAALSVAVVPANVLGQQPAQATVVVRKTRISGYPYAFATPEAGVAFGLGGIVTFYTSATDTILRPSKVTVGGWYSLNNQYKLSVVPQVTMDRNQWQLNLPIDFGRFTDKFWGIGNTTPELPYDSATDSEIEDFRSEVMNVKLDVQGPLPIFHSIRSGVLLEFNNTRIVDAKLNPYLNADTVLGTDGGQTFGLGVTSVWDTRNHAFFPETGGFYQVRALWFPILLGTDYAYGRIEADFRTFLRRGPDEVVALQAYGNFILGNAPFYALSALGGSNRMRGYFQGRYRDKHLVVAQAEYRRLVWKRLGFTLFGGVGDVFGSDATEFAISNLKWSLGGGLRFRFNQAEKVNLRVDFGFGRDTKGVYFQLEEAF